MGFLTAENRNSPHPSPLPKGEEQRPAGLSHLTNYLVFVYESCGASPPQRSGKSSEWQSGFTELKPYKSQPSTGTSSTPDQRHRCHAGIRDLRRHSDTIKPRLTHSRTSKIPSWIFVMWDRER